MKVILWDLDGTIINSAEGITKCAQYALKECGIEEPDLERLHCFIGPPLFLIFRERYGMTEEETQNAVRIFRTRYNEEGIFECCLYNGVKDAIARLKKKGYIQALASSKPEPACRRILEYFGLATYFDEIVGSTPDGTIGTKAEVLRELEKRLSYLDLEKDEMCLIGDTKYDAVGAVEFGVQFIGVGYGFGTREELFCAGAKVVFDSIEEVESYIEKGDYNRANRGDRHSVNSTTD